MKKRTNYTAEFKAKVVLEILSDEYTVNQLAATMTLVLLSCRVGKWSS
jgi:transposase-like protein